MIPHIGAERLQRLNEPQLLQLYGKLLSEGRVKRDQNSAMYAYWSDQTAKGEKPTAREISAACNTTIHAARAAVRRYRSGIAPKETSPGLAPKTVRNIHALIHRALVDAVAWKYIADNPASNVSHPSAHERVGRSGIPTKSGPSSPQCGMTGSPLCSYWN